MRCCRSSTSSATEPIIVILALALAERALRHLKDGVYLESHAY